MLLAAFSFSFDQPSSIDVALTLALLSLPGALVMAMFFERWL
jgi:multicomponent Na+:H+ antiporter subunit F